LLTQVNKFHTWLLPPLNFATKLFAAFYRRHRHCDQQWIKTIQFAGRFRIARSTIITHWNRTARFMRQCVPIFDVWHARKWSSNGATVPASIWHGIWEVIDNEYACCLIFAIQIHAICFVHLSQLITRSLSSSRYSRYTQSWPNEANCYRIVFQWANWRN